MIPARNAFKESAQAAKAAKLIPVIDAAFDLAKITLPEARLDSVSGMGDSGWAAAASVAGCNLPSPETREAVIACYERRVRASVDAQIAASIAGALKSAGAR